MDETTVKLLMGLIYDIACAHIWPVRMAAHTSVYERAPTSPHWFHELVQLS